MDKATSPIAGTRSHLLMLWDMLDQRERRQAYRVLLLAILAAVGSSAMVASVMPFLAVLADPTIVQTSPRMSWAYRTFGFDSDLSFLGGFVDLRHRNRTRPPRSRPPCA